MSGLRLPGTGPVPSLDERAEPLHSPAGLLLPSTLKGTVEAMTLDAVKKERALFYLDRRLKALEEVVVKHEGLAEAGLSYEARRHHQATVDQKNEENQHEREALQWLRDQVLEKL